MACSKSQKTRYVFTQQGPPCWHDNLPSQQALTLIPIYSKIKPVKKLLEYSLPSEPSDLNGNTEDFEFKQVHADDLLGDKGSGYLESVLPECECLLR